MAQRRPFGGKIQCGGNRNAHGREDTVVSRNQRTMACSTFSRICAVDGFFCFMIQRSSHLEESWLSISASPKTV